MFSYSHFLSPLLLGYSPAANSSYKSPLSQLLHDKVTMLRTKSLLKYNTTERFNAESVSHTPEPGKKRVNIRIETPTISSKANPKSVFLKSSRRLFDYEISRSPLPSLSRYRKLAFVKPHAKRSMSPCTALSRSRTPTPSPAVPSTKSPLPTPKKQGVPRFEEKGVLGVVGNCSVAAGSDVGTPAKGKLQVGITQADLWHKELKDFLRSVEKRASDWYEELDYECKGYISRQDILDKLRLQKYISPKFQYLDHKKAAFFKENQKESTFNSINGSPQTLGNTDRMMAETEDTYLLLNALSTDRLTKNDITGLVAVFEFNSTSRHQQYFLCSLDLLNPAVLKRLAVQLRELKEVFDCYARQGEIVPDDLFSLSKVFERDNLQVDAICSEITESSIDFYRFLAYLPFFMRLHLTVIKLLRI